MENLGLHQKLRLENTILNYYYIAKMWIMADALGWVSKLMV